jgi:predicted TIM-barrel fold metal-dependent hydrolase
MSGEAIGTRGVYLAEKEATLPYRVFDADHHIRPPQEARVRHLENKYVEQLAATGGLGVPDPEGELEGMGEKSLKSIDSAQWQSIGMHAVPEGGFGGVDLSELPGMKGDFPIPGAMLNKLNPLRDLDQLSRVELIERYNQMRPAFERREPRLALMDIQGIEAAVVHTGGFGNEPAFLGGEVELGYAVTRAWNRYVLEDWGFNTNNRIYCPLQVPLVDVDMAVKELEWGIEHKAAIVNLPAGDAYGRSPFDPYFDPVWDRINEAGLRVTVHLGGGTRVDLSSDWSEDGTAPYPKFDAFQWILYWSDRPIMETVTAMIFHNLFGRFPKVKVLLAEFGTVWVPYLLRKLDHAVMLGRKPTFGQLPGRPTEVFKEHVIVAPYPEENITRAADVVGWDCLVFGSDFPHSEGLPDPMQYVTQLKGLDDSIVRKVMHDNLANFLPR